MIEVVNNPAFRNWLAVRLLPYENVFRAILVAGDKYMDIAITIGDTTALPCVIVLAADFLDSAFVSTRPALHRAPCS